jgi:hypothetical protein
MHVVKSAPRLKVSPVPVTPKVMRLLHLTLPCLLLSGCAEISYTQYQGQQQNWPTQPGAFVKTVDGIPIYHGLPSQYYNVLGQIVSVDGSDHDLARIARTNHADAVIITDTRTINSGAVTLPGPVNTFYFANSSTAIAGPSYTSAITSDATTAWVIKYKADPFADLIPTNSPSRHLDNP